MRKEWVYYGILGLLGFLWLYIFFLTRFIPTGFPVGSTFVINENESLRIISKRLEDEHLISSALLFRVWVSLKKRDRHVQLGIYEFKEPLVLGAVVKRLVFIGPDHPLLRVTIPEGSKTEDIAKIITTELPTISPDTFIHLVVEKDAQGKLFPSTYFLLPSTNEERIISTMTAMFAKVYDEHFSSLPKPKYVPTDGDVVSLAAILEGEAKTVDDMKIVSGILQKRLAINMPLQVDVAKETYKMRGLPKIPISNPGENALDAVFHPTQTSYLYYLTGKDGTMYYAKTFEEHKRNISKYLR